MLYLLLLIILGAYRKISKDKSYNLTRNFLFKCAHMIPIKNNNSDHIMEPCQMMSLHCYLAFAMAEKRFCSCNKLTQNQTEFERCSVFQIVLDHNPCLGYNDPNVNVSKPTVLEHNVELLNEKSFNAKWVQIILGNRFLIQPSASIYWKF